MIKKELIVEKDEKLISALQRQGFSYADVLQMMRKKDVRVNGKVTKKNLLLRAGDEVVYYHFDDIVSRKFEIQFENEEVVVIYKHSGIESTGALEEAVKGIAVHRLDRNTEGLLVFAKNEGTKQKLLKAFKEHKVRKFYVAEVAGNFQVDQTFEAYLSKDSENSIVHISSTKKAGSLKISTKIKTLKAGRESSLVEVELLTGRTHQIRAHLAFLGHSIVGDGKYGKNKINRKFHEKTQKLACFLLKFGYIGVESLNFKEFERMPDWFEK